MRIDALQFVENYFSILNGIDYDLANYHLDAIIYVCNFGPWISLSSQSFEYKSFRLVEETATT